MVATITSSQTVLAMLQKEYPSVSIRSIKFKRLAARLAAEHDLSSYYVTQLAMSLGLKWYPRPKNLPENWKLILCKSFLSQRYVNPIDPEESIVVKPPCNFGAMPHLIHRTSHGLADAAWFYEIVPQLEQFLKDPTTGHVFSKTFNKNLNEKLENDRKGLGMTIGQVQAINLFFDKYVPELEGICTTCFRVSLPKSGAGERWTHRSNERYEIRLSAAKLNGREGQQVEYVSHTEVNHEQKLIFAAWNKKQKAANFSDEMAQKNTHIPWDVYDFNKFKIGMPLCNCLKKKS